MPTTSPYQHLARTREEIIPTYGSILPIVHAAMGPELNNHQSKARRQDTLGKRCCSSLASASLLLACVALLLLDLAQVVIEAGAEPGPDCGGRANCKPGQSFALYLEQLKQMDKCSMIYTSQRHGYVVRDYTVHTNDNYELTLHRLVHPEDQQQPEGGQKKPKRKPYLLVHGLFGTSASFVTNIDDKYWAPSKTFNATPSIADKLAATADEYKYEFESTAERLGRTWAGERAERNPKKERQFAELLELQFDGEHMRFEREFRQSYKKYSLPDQSLNHVTNSLAFTLSNFGYDVWLVNLRGNQYSRYYKEPESLERTDSSSSAEYWDFDIEKVIKNDLIATIKFIKKATAIRGEDPIGVVSYSYSSMYLMRLLTDTYKYQKKLRPVIMLAPTMLTRAEDRDKVSMALRAFGTIISKNGPFPAHERNNKESFSATKLIQKRLCSIPMANSVCGLMESTIQGQAKGKNSRRKLNEATDSMKRDLGCGQTSRAIVHEIIKNLSDPSMDLKYKPFSRSGQMRVPAPGSQRPNYASIMLIHSDSDYISSEDEVARMRKHATKFMTLADYAIREPDFSHTDFLFSLRNQYLVNAEVARMALVHDYVAAK